jgi:pSer/pThr/pTyr-binding forkhead associated (FHA) protein
MDQEKIINMKLVKIGRSVDNTIVVKDDTTISRNHAEIFQDDEGNIFLTDLNSSNGTYVNGKKLKESTIIAKYDIVKVGNTVINWYNHFRKKNIKESIVEEKELDKNEKILINEISDSLDSTKDTNYFFFAIPLVIALIYTQFNYGINNLFFVFDILSLLFIPSLIAFLISSFSKVKFEYSVSVLSVIVIAIQHFII